MKLLKLLAALALAAFPVLAQQQQFPGAGGVTSSIFYISNSCAGLSNCLQWVDDDSTDNCGSATTAFMALINGYAGPGESHVFITGSGSGKAYKLSTCNLVFSGPSGTGGQVGSPNVFSQATIDCAQSTANCIQLGASSGTAYNTAPMHNVTWRGGTFTGCASVTNACIETMPFVFIAALDDVTFINTGAGNATLGTCTNYSVQWDHDIGGIESSRLTSFGTVKGQCFSNNNDNSGTGGANTIEMRGWQISHTTGAACGGQLHFDASNHSTIENNLLFGFASIITLSNPLSGTGAAGWIINGNNMDTSGCTIASGNAASVQVTGSNQIGPVTLTNNNFYTSPAIGDFAANTPQLVSWLVTGNNNSSASIGTLFASNLSCNQVITSASTIVPCVLGANQNFYTGNVAGTNTNPGWLILSGNNGHFFAATKTANIGATNINTGSLTSGTYQVLCTAIVTTAATTSSTLPSCTIGWTDLFTSVAETVTVFATNAANTVGTLGQGQVFVTISSGANITVSTSGYASTGGTAMQYGAFADITKVF